MKQLICSLWFFMIFLSCSKNDIKEEIVKSDANGLNETEILVFNSMDEVNDRLDEVLDLSIEELKAYEDRRGYKSFGRECEEFYNSIGPESFKTTCEAKDFVSKNSNYLQLIDEGNEEYSVEVRMYDVLERFLINRDKMFQVIDEVYKVFDIGIAACSIDNIDLLKAYSRNDFLLKGATSEIRIARAYLDNFQKDAANDCGIYDIVRSEPKDNERIKMELRFDVYAEGGVTNGMVGFFIRPQKKVLGLWWRVEREVTADWKIAYDFSLDDVWVGRETIEYSISDYLTNNYQNPFFFPVYWGVGMVDIDWHFDDYRMWAKLDDETDWDYYAKLSCDQSSIYPEF